MSINANFTDTIETMDEWHSGNGDINVDVNSDVVLIKSDHETNTNDSDYTPAPSNQGNQTRNNEQIHLWQFLLEILTDKQYKNIIQWHGNQGEFKLVNPDQVAALWGSRKNRTNMNYEKLARALRYYYDGDMISKVKGKKFIYQFICDLRKLTGYTAQQMSDMVNGISRAKRARQS